jgi:N-acetylmuramoyl-L-alanine amidase
VNGNAIEKRKALAMSGFATATGRLKSKAVWLAALLSLVAVVPAFHTSPLTPPQKKQSARTLFDKAETAREALQSKPMPERKLSDYQAVLRLYRNVPILAPTIHQAPDSIFQEAHLNQEMALRFPADAAKYRAEARNLFQLLLREYPQTRHRKESNQAIAIMDSEEEERAAAAPPARVSPVSTGSGAAPGTSADDSRGNGKLVLISNIREWSTPTYTRVVIDLDEEIKFEAGRIPNPDRIYFDLHNTKLTPALKDHTKEVADGLLKKLRTGTNRVGTTRVVLEVGPVTTYSAFLLPNPYRLVIDVQGVGHQPITSADGLIPGAPPALSSVAARLDPAPRPDKSEPNVEPEAMAKPPMSKASDGRKPKSKPADVANDYKPADTGFAPAATSTPDESSKPITSDRTDEDAIKNNATPGSVEIPSTKGPTTEPVYEKVSRDSPAAANSGSRTNAKNEVTNTRPDRLRNEPVRTIAAPAPTSNGQRSLTRALGLKIGRIVIDAGHGGHDTGTIGPTGYSEKDLVLDVAKRLGEMVEEKLGSQVVYTRNDDTFIPLEMRTAIANQKQADLFVSIHANASPDAKARGIETYYLSFSTSQEALEVAARENAVSEKSIHELQDLVKKITLYEKVEESKEFAGDVQKSLYSGMSRGNTGLRNRGVRKAPFVVLIGANMPSILAEISFVSNPQDEKLLRKPEYRQRIAESLFRGIQHYASNLGGVKVASQRAEVPGQ